MPESSLDPVESTRKNGARLQGEVLRRLADVTQERAADCMGMSASTISRAKEDLDRFCHLLAALGFQLAPVGSVVTNPEDQRALKRMALQWLQADLERDLRNQPR